jgi:dehydrogenase/reductase SDR family protein 7B
MTAGELTGRVVWITGASSGLGEALALACARAGARLVLSSRQTKELERVAHSCIGCPETPMVLPLDLTRPQDFAPAAARVVAQFGRIDLLVNNGGVSQRALAQETLPAVERAIMEVNYFGAIGLTKAVLPVMLAQRAGTIVVVSSVMGYVGTPLRAAYAASKHALHGWFDSLREEVHGGGLRVLIVCPGYVKTKVSENALTATGATHARLDAGQARGMAPGECAAAILRALERGADEVLIGGPEIWAVRLKRWWPRLLQWALRRAVARGRF